MLVLTRKPAETIKVGDDVVIKVIKTTKGAVKIGIEAPDDVRVIRGELLADEPLRREPAARTEPAVSNLAERFGALSDQYPHVA